MTRKEIDERLIQFALKYDKDDVESYICDIGWDAEWMSDYMEDPEEEMLSDEDRRNINSVLISAFERAHQVQFNGRYYWDHLLYS